MVNNIYACNYQTNLKIIFVPHQCGNNILIHEIKTYIILAGATEGAHKKK